MTRLRLLGLVGAVCLSPALNGQPPGYIINTVAGGGPDNVVALTAPIDSTAGVTADTAGNIYFAAPAWNRIFQLTPGGILSVFAGNGRADYKGDGKPARDASLYGPTGVAFDGSGNLYIADRLNHCIRKVSNGVISTVAGQGELVGSTGDGGLATGAKLSSPYAVALDSAGNLYIADTGNHKIRVVDAVTKQISTFAGTGASGYTCDSCLALTSKLASPMGLAVDQSDNVYIADSNNHRIRRVIVSGASTGNIYTVAGTGTATYNGTDQSATVKNLDTPSGIAIDRSAGILYIADTNHSLIRSVVISTWYMTNLAGVPNQGGYNGDGAAGTQYLNHPIAVGLTSTAVVVSDSTNKLVRSVGSSQIATIAGNAQSVVMYFGDGIPATSAVLRGPRGVGVDNLGNIYISDYANGRVRRVDAATGNITNYAGNGTSGYTGNGGPATSATLGMSIRGLATDAARNLYIADWDNHAVRRVDANSRIITSLSLNTGGRTLNPYGLAFDTSGRLYIGDFSGCVVWRADMATMEATVYAGTFNNCAATVEGRVATSTTLQTPYGITVDPSGNLYIAYEGWNQVFQVDPVARIITRFAGDAAGASGSTGDGGPSVSAKLNGPFGLASDASGNIFISEYNGERIRWVEASSGKIYTVAGTGVADFSGDGGPATAAAMFGPSFLAADSQGRVLLNDEVNNRIRALTRVAVLSISKSHSGHFRQGQTGATYTVLVSNQAGTGPTTGTVTVTESLPTGFTLVSMSGSGWTCSGITCTRSDSLNPGASYPPITVTVNVSANAAASRTNYVFVSGGGSNTASTTDLTYVDTNPPTLVIALTHTGNFAQGQSGATYTVTVSNAAGAGMTSGTVTVSANVPTGLTLVSMSGSGWTCTSAICYRSDVLNGGGSYPPITMTVNVSSTAPSPVTNQVTVSGGGSAAASASDPTTITGTSQHPMFFSGEATLANGVYYLQFPNGILFGYYSYLSGGFIYHIDLGYEYVFADPNDPQHNAYLWDFRSGHWFFTGPSLFPYIYDFTLGAWIYYIPDVANPGHYTANPRQFAYTSNHQIFTM